MWLGLHYAIWIVVADYFEERFGPAAA